MQVNVVGDSGPAAFQYSCQIDAIGIIEDAQHAFQLLAGPSFLAAARSFCNCPVLVRHHMTWPRCTEGIQNDEAVLATMHMRARRSSPVSPFRRRRSPQSYRVLT